VTKYDPQKHHRRSIRLPGYDYSMAGVYFVTICTLNQTCLFGTVVDDEIVLNEYGRIVLQSWEWLRDQYPYVDLQEWVIMPNHLHGIIMINHDDANCRGGSRTALIGMGDPGLGGSRTAPTKPLGRIIGAFKTISTKHVNLARNQPGMPVWQRNYYEHIIRNDDAYNRIAEYIINNPKRWEEDKLWKG